MIGLSKIRNLAAKIPNLFSYAFTTRELNIVLLEGKTSLNLFLDGRVHPLQKHKEHLFCYTILAQVWATPSSKKKVGLNFLGKNLIERSENVDFGEGVVLWGSVIFPGES